MVSDVSTTAYLIPIEKLSDFFLQSVGANFKGKIIDLTKEQGGYVFHFPHIIQDNVKLDPKILALDADIASFLLSLSGIDLKGKTILDVGFGDDSSFIEVTVQ